MTTTFNLESNFTFLYCKYHKCQRLFQVAKFDKFTEHHLNIKASKMQQVSHNVDILLHLTLKVLVATIDALGHFETG